MRLVIINVMRKARNRQNFTESPDLLFGSVFGVLYIASFSDDYEAEAFAGQ
jgi:hypothetical protein